MSTRIGTCSLCGGSVMAYLGGWWSISPPPAPTCSQCGAVAYSDVIKTEKIGKFDKPEWKFIESRTNAKKEEL